MHLRSMAQHALAAVLCVSWLATPAEAGPLLDWLLGRHRKQPAYPVGQPYPAGSPSDYGANYGGYAYPGMTYNGQYSSGYAPQYAISQPYPQTYSSVPDFRSSAYRAPVTYYRPLLTTDPNNGQQVVGMAPCTSYEYQTNRVPIPGRRSLFGSYAGQMTAPQSIAPPTYSLPSGGVPLSYAAPNNTRSPTSRSYATYPPSSTSTYYTPDTTSRYYQSPSGGSCGNYYNPSPGVPGGSAPQGPSNSYPSSPSDSGSSPSGGVYPPSSDPADNIPSLRPVYPDDGYPSTSSSSYENRPVEQENRPDFAENGSRLRSVIRSPQSDQRATSAPIDSNGRSATDRQSQGEPRNRSDRRMRPIPAPDDFDPEPHWNPGLLREGDMTARNDVDVDSRAAEYAGQAKAIHWASFEEPKSAEAFVQHAHRPQAPDERQARDVRPEPDSGGRGGLQLSPSNRSATTAVRESPQSNTPNRRLRPIAPSQSANAVGNDAGQAASTTAGQPSASGLSEPRPRFPSQPRGRNRNNRYDTRGWEATPGR